MDPIPETVEALRELARGGNPWVSELLRRLNREILEVVPQTVGLSLGLVSDPFTFTLVANSELVQELDAVQYVDDGPCVTAMHTGDIITTTSDQLLDENKWHMFARSLSIHGIESTLSVPVLRDGRVVSGVNLYASTADAFDGHHEQVALICGGWAAGAVSNADLTFNTLLEAVETPGRMRDQSVVDQAVGLLADVQRISFAVAATRIREAAARAGITPSQAALSVIRALSDS